MSSITGALPQNGRSGLQKILEPEQESLLRMSRLVEHVFRVPVAYLALLGPAMTITSRIGVGTEYWLCLERICPLEKALSNPWLWRNSEGACMPFGCQEIQFCATAPLRSSDGLDLGLLVIADLKPRPDFSDRDHETLNELACVLAGKMELRVIACEAREAELAIKEAESRFRSIANAAPVMIVCSGIDGMPAFFNKAWLEFTGRNLEDEIGGGFAEMFHPHYREAAIEKYWDAFENREPISQEIPMRRHDGEYRWMLTQGRPRFQDDGTFSGYIGCFVDVTEQRSGAPPDPR